MESGVQVGRVKNRSFIPNENERFFFSVGSKKFREPARNPML